MLKQAFALAASAVVFSCLATAGTINWIDVQTGVWSNGSFLTSGEWNTYANWAVGATNPGFGNTLLNSSSSTSLPDGEYWLYMASDGTTVQAIRIALGYAGGAVTQAIFVSPGNVEATGPYTLVSGSGMWANNASGPQTAFERVGRYQNYSSDGTANWIVDLKTGDAAAPEPGSWMLLAAGVGLLAAVRRKLT